MSSAEQAVEDVVGDVVENLVESPVDSPASEKAPLSDQEAAAQAMLASDGVALAKIAASHVLVTLLVLSMFAAADSWAVISGIGLATLLSVLTAFLAGVTIATFVHEWFHYLGARRSGGAYTIPRKLSLFVFDWTFDKNTVEQFVTMSVAGSIGGVVSILLLWNTVPTDTLGRSALLASAFGAFVFAAIIEWPVLKRARISREPFAELSKIDRQVLTRALIGGLATVFLLTPLFS